MATTAQRRLAPKERRHFGSLRQTHAIPDLTEILQKILKRLDTGHGNPDYNLIFHTAPVSVNDSEQAFRWYIQLYPRLSLSGGFELATDIYINIVSPKSAAAFYRNETD